MNLIKKISPWIVLLVLMLVPPLIDYSRTGNFGKLTIISESIAALAVVGLIVTGAVNQSKKR